MSNELKAAWELANSLVGSDTVVEVTIAHKGDPKSFSGQFEVIETEPEDVTLTGVLLSLSYEGDFSIRNLYGQVQYAWPLLDCRKVDAPF